MLEVTKLHFKFEFVISDANITAASARLPQRNIFSLNRASGSGSLFLSNFLWKQDLLPGGK